MEHNKLIEESAKIFNAALKEGSGGERSLLRKAEAEKDQNPATNRKLKRIESRLARKQREGVERIKARK